MGQKTNPIGNRLGTIRGWEPNWYGSNDYGDKLAGSNRIRKHVQTRLSEAGVAHVIIEHAFNLITVIIITVGPGTIIGKGGQEIDKLKEELKEITGKDIQINIFEVRRPKLNAVPVATSIANQIGGHVSYKRAIKMAMAPTMRMNAEGVKMMISGRPNGAEMACSESLKEGRIPPLTFRVDIDYATNETYATYERVGIKMRIIKGEIYGKRGLLPLIGMIKKVSGGNFSSRSNNKPTGAPKKARRKK